MSEQQPSGVRKLSAIMFSDMAGFTALMQRDEARAMRDRNRQRAVLNRYISENGGRVLQTYGDGTLAVFDSAVGAVTSAIAVQRELAREPAVPLRIGIHTGDVVHEEEGVFGDGVNVASRIQGLGTPGSVLISAKVFDEIKNHAGLSAVSLGEFDLKNVQRPMEVFGITAQGIAVPAPESLPGRTQQQRKSVAVLPFVNMSADPDNAYFSDGISEELINLLTRVNGLQVTARTSSFAFKGKDTDVREIARQLGVGMVLEGSVRKAGDRVRVTAQLIDASNGFHLFSENYDRQLADIFELQDEIARTIVDTVQDRLQPERKLVAAWDARFDRLASFLATQRTSTEAHSYYLHALYEYNKWTPEALRRAIELLEKCLAEDPDYAPAHAALSRAFAFLASTGQAEVQEGWRRAEASGRRAIELDPNLSEGHVALGMSDLFYRWNAESAAAQLQKGLTLAPGSANAHHAIGIYYVVIGDHERAIEEMEIAVRSDPLSMLILYSLAWALFEAGRYEDAIAVHERILSTDPTFRAAHEGKGFCLLQLGRLDDALDCFDRVVQITGDPYKGLAPRGYTFTLMGRTDEARRTLEMIRERAERHPELSLEIDIAMVHAGLGEIDEAFDHFEKAAQKRLAEVLFSVNSIMWDGIRKLPRYWKIISRYGLDTFARNPPG